MIIGSCQRDYPQLCYLWRDVCARFPGLLPSSLPLFLSLVCAAAPASFMFAAPLLLGFALAPTAETSVAPVFPVSQLDIEPLLAFASAL